MDPKHQFAAQYMLSRAAAERREQIAANLLSIAQNSRGASPALSDTSSCNERLSPPPENLHNNNTSGTNNNNNNNSNSNNNNVNNDGNAGINESASDNNNNTNGATNPLSLNNVAAYNHKHPMNDVLRSQSAGGQLHHQYQQVVANALSAAAQNQQNACNGLVSPVNPSTSAAQAISSLVAMRQTQSHGGMNGGSQQTSPTGPYHHNSQSITNPHQNNPHHPHHQDQSEATLRIQEALRSQAEAALRLAVSQAAAVVASNGNSTNEISSNNQYRHNNAYGHQTNSINNLQSQFVGPDLSEALRLQEQRIEQALRLHNNELGLHQQQHQHP